MTLYFPIPLFYLFVIYHVCLCLCQIIYIYYFFIFLYIFFGGERKSTWILKNEMVLSLQYIIEANTPTARVATPTSTTAEPATTTPSLAGPGELCATTQDLAWPVPSATILTANVTTHTIRTPTSIVKRVNTVQLQANLPVTEYMQHAPCMQLLQRQSSRRCFIPLFLLPTPAIVVCCHCP